ncbi:MAG: methyltransferase domain-containing protein [Anaerolineales bacterium]
MNPKFPNNRASQGERIIDLYRRQAKGYDASGIGALESKRRQAVGLLKLSPGDLVVDIGCGTGLNFPFLQSAVGSSGKIIGVDLTDAMLNQARERVSEHGWQNIELVQCDASVYEFPDGVDGIISAFALTFIPDAYGVIQNGAAALAPGKRFVVLDMAWPRGWPLWLRHLIPLLPSYGVTSETIQRRPWESIRNGMTKNLSAQMVDFWMG